MSISNEQLFTFLRKNPIGIGCVLLSLVLVGFIYSRGELLPAARGLLDEKSTEGERLAANVKYSNQLREQVDEIVAAGKAIDGRLIYAAQLASNLEYFYKLEADTNTRLLSLTPLTTPARPGNAKTTFVPIGFTLNVQGSYAQILDFLHRLENGLHYARILNATCAKVSVEGDLLTLNLNVELLGQR
jgi:hypothetical protein